MLREESDYIAQLQLQWKLEKRQMGRQMHAKKQLHIDAVACSKLRSACALARLDDSKGVRVARRQARKEQVLHVKAMLKAQNWKKTRMNGHLYLNWRTQETVWDLRMHDRDVANHGDWASLGSWENRGHAR